MDDLSYDILLPDIHTSARYERHEDSCVCAKRKEKRVSLTLDVHVIASSLRSVATTFTHFFFTWSVLLIPNSI